jgi:hypothetical protein
MFNAPSRAVRRRASYARARHIFSAAGRVHWPGHEPGQHGAAMSDEGSGKTAHIVGVGVIGFGAIFARVADDCGRVGLRGASMLDDGARFGRASALADDGFRAARSPTLADDALRSSRAAPLTDDGLARARALADDGAGAAEPVAVDARAGLLEHSHSGKLAGELAEGAVDVTLELLQNTGDDPARRPVPPARARTRTPGLLTLLPADGESHDPKASPPVSGIELAKRLDEWRAHDPLGLLLVSIGPPAIDRPLALALPGGRRVTDTVIHRLCRARGLDCLVLACSPEPASRDACVAAANDLWTTASLGHRGAARAFLTRLLTARADSDAGRAIVVSRVDGSGGGDVGIVRSKLRRE